MTSHFVCHMIYYFKPRGQPVFLKCKVYQCLRYLLYLWLTFSKIQQTEPDGRSHADGSLSSLARLYSAAAERPWWGRTVVATLIRWAWCIAQTAVLRPPFSAAAPWASIGSKLLQSAAHGTVTAEPWRLHSGATPATLQIMIQITWIFRNWIKVIVGCYFY